MGIIVPTIKSCTKEHTESIWPGYTRYCYYTGTNDVTSLQSHSHGVCFYMDFSLLKPNLGNAHFHLPTFLHSFVLFLNFLTAFLFPQPACAFISYSPGVSEAAELLSDWQGPPLREQQRAGERREMFLHLFVWF